MDFDHVPGNFAVFTGTYEELAKRISSLNTLVVVLFTEPWCPPCRPVSEHFLQLARDFPSVSFLSINGDSRELFKAMNVYAVPELKCLHMGQGNTITVLCSITGNRIDDMRANIQKFLSK